MLGIDPVVEINVRSISFYRPPSCMVDRPFLEVHVKWYSCRIDRDPDWLQDRYVAPSPAGSHEMPLAHDWYKLSLVFVESGVKGWAEWNVPRLRSITRKWVVKISGL